MASSLQALSNVIKNATTREQPTINVGGTKEEEDKLEREENNLTATGNTGGTLALTAMGTNGSGDANGSGLRRLTRATLKTPAEPDSSKGETVLTLDPTTTQQPKKAGKKRKAPTDSSELRELLGATHVLGGKGTGKGPFGRARESELDLRNPRKAEILARSRISRLEILTRS
ncbi:hypothetical protein MJO28_011502 [Puccinia striiformis f. sp. tritici]|uniref:Uncharacterized protein n=1 Tax=Puccinia striiformis f. sp. tritici TaxID=168172 RepID=A0ACC0E3W8_9BASI|nr:hypothetical protein Pst134EA_021122 [Puccinia striiformis f. sp. tritici]KAH9457239.1 hypothetical protein Pst134EA_021122 [Puccinia striiformis f. sp. tritici]KAI7943974.1 hypothetical protein MJO28_011502 [Puccinia striiformis f. sp. tritici]KAI9599661.1 hypothetical protein KEM48_008875 [Puccinia striiformis f. sp. tritici PST-130]KAI9614855.1 hypothetical protein H4Q26_009253 [Puccinia striiformis f. sp. tritici PST-130]